MSIDVLEFYALPERERRRGQASLAVLDRAGARDQVEFSVVRPDGARDSVRIPKAAVALIRDVLAKLLDSVWPSCARMMSCRPSRPQGFSAFPVHSSSGAWIAVACRSVTSAHIGVVA
jgi:hypothetical protein